MSKNKRTQLLVHSIWIGLGVFFFWYMKQHWSELLILFDVRIVPVLLIALLYLFFFALNGLFLELMLRCFHVSLPAREYVSLAIFTNFCNTFLPLRGGAGVRAAYLKKNYHLSYINFLVVFAGSYIITFACTGVLALCALTYLAFAHNYFNIFLTFIFCSMLCGAVFSLFLKPSQIQWVPWKAFRVRIEHMLEGWKTIKKSGLLLFQLTLVTLLNTLILTLTIFFEFRALNIQTAKGAFPDLFQSLFLALVNTLSLYFSITPGALGVREAFLMGVAHVVQVSPSDALAVAILDRAIIFAILLIATPFVICILGKGVFQLLQTKNSQRVKNEVPAEAN